MKVLFRVLVVLAAASLVGGAIFAAVNMNGTGSQQPSFQQTEGDRPRPEGDRERAEGGFGFPFGVVKSLVMISVVAVVYLNGSKWFGKASRINKQIET